MKLQLHLQLVASFFVKIFNYILLSIGVKDFDSFQFVTLSHFKTSCFCNISSMICSAQYSSSQKIENL